MRTVAGFSSRLNTVEERSHEAEGILSESIQNAAERVENKKEIKRHKGIQWEDLICVYLESLKRK